MVPCPNRLLISESRDSSTILLPRKLPVDKSTVGDDSLVVDAGDLAAAEHSPRLTFRTVREPRFFGEIHRKVW